MKQHHREKTTFGLLRHGKTVWNQEKRIQGSGNSPLTPDGIAALKAWAAFLHSTPPTWDRLIVSPLQRAIDSAKIINERLQLPMQIEDELREQNWGLWEGLTIDEIKSADPDELEKRIQNGWNFLPPEGESRQEVLQRTRGCLEKCARQYTGQHLLVITHLGVIKTLLYSIEKRPFLPSEPKILWKNRFHLIAQSETAWTILTQNIFLPGNSDLK
ncbi:MAG: histidine phosphatase family protein [Desulfofustis sp.]|nr:histidine phosphatase family protein [Desulfofustis sp.]